MTSPKSTKASPVEEPAVVYRDADFGVVVLSNLIVVSARTKPSRAFLDSFVANSNEILASHPQIAILVVIDSSSRPPSDEDRTMITEMLGRLGKSVVGLAHVVEGAGFVAAAFRGALSMLSLLSRFPFPLRAFGAVPDAAVWLAERLRETDSGALTSGAIVAAAHAARDAQREG